MSQSTPPEGFKACEVTGEILPADSLVHFQGKWVSEKGKQILLERLQSGEDHDAPTDLVRPGFWRRLGCILLDWMIVSLIGNFVPDFFGKVTLNFWGNPENESVAAFSHEMLKHGVGVFIAFAGVTAYFGLLQSGPGQSPGKRLGRESVVLADGSPADRRARVLRGGCFAAPLLLLAVGLFTQSMAAFRVFYFLAVAWALLDVICLLVDVRTQRALHDRLAGTRVILLSPNS